MLILAATAIMPRMSFLQKNLAALSPVNPTLAAQVGAMEIPSGFERVNGTDGTPTFRRIAVDAEGKKRVEWLGSTSMPRASAEGLVSSLDPVGGTGGPQNGLGLSIGTGHEWAAFCRRLGRTQAVYVYDPTPALRMALEICDLSALLAEKEIVLLTGTTPQAGEMLVNWLDTHLGMDAPAVLHPLPTAGGGNIETRNALLAAGEAIVRQGMLQRQQRLTALADRLAEAANPKASAGHLQTIAFTLTARYPEERPLHAVVERNRWPAVAVDKHDTVGIGLRLEKLAEALERGSVRLVSDLFRSHLTCIPPAVAVETWIPPLAGPGFWERLPAAAEVLANDRLIVHAEDHRNRLLSHGISGTQIELKPVPPLRRSISPPTTGITLRHRVAIIGDLPRISINALEIVLPTHQAVYAAARELIAQDYLTLHTGAAPDLLRRAFSKAGIPAAQAEDPALRGLMLRLVRDLLLPAMTRMSLATALVEERISVTLIGEWPEWETRPGTDVRIVPFASQPEERWREVAVLAHVAPDGAVSPLMWEAVAAGVPLIAAEQATDAWPGSIAALLAQDAYAHPRPGQYFPVLRGLLNDASQRQKLASAALQMLRP